MNKYELWFGRFIWLGILANLLFAIPAIADPPALVSLLDIDTPAFSGEHIWLRNVGMLLIGLCVFYAGVGREPLKSRGFAVRAVVVRFLAATFWFWMVLSVAVADVFWYFAAVDGLLALVQAYFLARALAVSRLEPAAAPWRRGILSRIYGAFFRLVNMVIPWHRLDWLTLWLSRGYLGTLNLGGIRTDLREWNLHDTTEPMRESTRWDPDYRSARSPDGTFNNLTDVNMGATGDTLGRNFPIREICIRNEEDLVGNPSPREVSRLILGRKDDDAFEPAPILNLLAAAWIQFQNHGWFNHYLMMAAQGASNGSAEFAEIPLADDDDWNPDQDGNPGRIMRIRRTQPIKARRGDRPAFASEESQWWDGSQLYGSTPARLQSLRSGVGGKLTVDKETGLLPEDPNLSGRDLTGFNQNWWLGLSLLHNLFAKEHNFICNELMKVFPDRDDEWLFQKARLINAALMAKIHTLDWTKNILRHPSLQISMNGNWWGVQGEWLTKTFGRLTRFESISGIPGSPTEHHTAPHSLLTEEFVSVYRMHPLIPDRVEFRKLGNSQDVVQRIAFEQIQGRLTRQGTAALGLSLEDQFYSFGCAHSGAVALGNYPRTFLNFEKDNGDRIDLAATDIFRDRERGVPPYNRFRELLRMPRVRNFEEMTGLNSDHPRVLTLKKLYDNDIDRVDLMVGLYAERPPKGFGFSDTAFRIFILMASRRLKSDRFFTNDFTPAVYTDLGMKWVQNNDMLSVLKRHHQGLTGVLRDVDNAFAPWQ